MRATRAILSLAAAVTLVACSHVPWTGKYMSGPAKRRHASEERAVQAIDEFFDASSDLIGLAAVDIHDDCLAAYWEDGAMTPERKRRIGDDRICSLALERFDEAAYGLSGYGQAPSGKYPWLGEVFEYVVRAETAKTKEEKMANLDRYVVRRFEELIGKHDSPVIRHVANDYYVIRGTCCRDVTIFDEWYKSRFERISSK
jgi:hypothetical protein